LAGLVHQLRADLDLVDRVIDQALDLLRGACTALREVAHFSRDDREAAALLAGARRFHRGVQRQQVGLERNLVDDADDVRDLAAGRVDLAHRAERALSAFCFPVAVISSMLDAVSSSDAACSCVRCERSSLPCDNWRAVEPTASALLRTSPTISTSLAS